MSTSTYCTYMFMLQKTKWGVLEDEKKIEKLKKKKEIYTKKEIYKKTKQNEKRKTKNENKTKQNCVQRILLLLLCFLS